MSKKYMYDATLSVEELTKKINTMKKRKETCGARAIELYTQCISRLELIRANKIGVKHA